ENAFKVPVFAVNPDVLRRIEPVGVLDRVKTSQTRVLTTLLENARIGRLIEQEAIDGAAAYKATDFFTDIRKGIWSELNAPQVRIDAYRRNLQRSYLDVLNDKLNGRTPANNDIRAFVRGELATLRNTIAGALGKTSDRATQLHLQDARDQIAKILDPKFQTPIGPVGGAGIGLMGDEELMKAENCFPDYAIR